MQKQQPWEELTTLDIEIILKVNENSKKAANNLQFKSSSKNRLIAAATHIIAQGKAHICRFSKKTDENKFHIINSYIFSSMRHC